MPGDIKPIIFSAPMVKALLAGRKTQTRRIIKPQPKCQTPTTLTRGIRFSVGDRLYVRETWKPHSTFDGMKPRDMPPSRIFYRADDTYAPSNTRWYPAIHMPRWASRMTLTVTDVRVQRLNEISEADAKAEGADQVGVETGEITSSSAPIEYGSYRAGFADLWNSINGPGSWDANPWIVAVSFDVTKGNINA